MYEGETTVMIIWKDVDVPIIRKFWHIHKLKGKVHRDFTKDCGDIPVGYINTITNKCEDVVNTRGLAYATRNRKKFLKGKKYSRKVSYVI